MVRGVWTVTCSGQRSGEVPLGLTSMTRTFVIPGTRTISFISSGSRDRLVVRTLRCGRSNPDLCRYEHFTSRDYGFGEPERPRGISTGETPVSSLTAAFSLPAGMIPPPLLAAVPPFIQSMNVAQPASDVTHASLVGRHFVNTNGAASAALHRRQRGEKKPIPDEQKDEKYYERRKRNNQAAKKSRDARKIREDHIALRATMLEHENAILRAQVVTLREEAQSLRHMLIKQQTPIISPVSPAGSNVTSIARAPRSPPQPTSTTLPCRV